MIKEKPIVTVVLPTYCHQRYVGAAIKSVLNQTLDQLELIIIDDYSPDDTWQIVKQFDDPRIIRYRHNKNCGSHQTINEGITESRGRYIAIINSDDIFNINRLEKMIHKMEDENIQLLGSDIELIDEKNNLIQDKNHYWIKWFESLKQIFRDTDDIVDTLLSGNIFISTSNFVAKRELFDKVGLFADYRFVPDYEFLFRCISEPNTKVDFVLNDCLLEYRLHNTNTILENALLANQETFSLLQNYFPKFFPNNFRSRGEIIADHMEKINGYIEIELIKERDQVIKERDQVIKEIHESVSFRLGRGILTPVRLIQRIFKRL